MRTMHIFILSVCVVLTVQPCYGSPDHQQNMGNVKLDLRQEIRPLTIIIEDTNDTTIVDSTTCYQGMVADNISLANGTIIASEKKYMELLGILNYSLPEIDYDANIVVLMTSVEPQVVLLFYDSLTYSEGKPMFGMQHAILSAGAENDGKNSFTLIVVPRSALLLESH